MEDPYILRKRLMYQSHHRGMRELDFVLGRFADERLSSMSYKELKEFEGLLTAPEQDLYGWVFKNIEVPQGPLCALVLALRGEIVLGVTEAINYNRLKPVV